MVAAGVVVTVAVFARVFLSGMLSSWETLAGATYTLSSAGTHNFARGIWTIMINKKFEL